MYDNDIKERCNLAQIPLAFEHFKRKFDVNFYTDFNTVAPFKTIFNHVAAKAQIIWHWQGQQIPTTTLDKPKSYQERINYRRCSLKKGALRNFAKFTEKHLCQKLFFK